MLKALIDYLISRILHPLDMLHKSKSLQSRSLVIQIPIPLLKSMDLQQLNAGNKPVPKRRRTTPPTTASTSTPSISIGIQPLEIPPTVFDPKWDHRYPRLPPEILYKQFEQLNPPVQVEIVKQLNELRTKQMYGIFVPDGPITNPFIFQPSL